MEDRKALLELLQPIAEYCSTQVIDESLADKLNSKFGDEIQAKLRDACLEGVEAGWACKHEAGGIRYGRVLKPNTELGPFSVDIVEMEDIAGPRHRHPKGEIDLTMPIAGEPTFDGNPAGWTVYGPQSQHSPTVAGGKALVLYLLPEGAIDFV